MASGGGYHIPLARGGGSGVPSDAAPGDEDLEQMQRQLELEQAQLREKQMTLNRHKMERQKRLEEQRRLEHQQRIEEQKRQEEMKRQEEERRRREKKRLEEQRKLEQQRLEQQRLEQQRLEQQRLEQQRLKQQRLEQQRLEQQRLEQQRLEKQRLEQQLRLEEQQLQEDRLRQQRQLERQRQEQLRLDEELRLGQQRLEQQKLLQHQQDEQKRLQLQRAMEIQRQQRRDELLRQQQQQRFQQEPLNDATLGRSTIPASRTALLRQQSLPAGAAATTASVAGSTMSKKEVKKAQKKEKKAVKKEQAKKEKVEKKAKKEQKKVEKKAKKEQKKKEKGMTKEEKAEARKDPPPALPLEIQESLRSLPATPAPPMPNYYSQERTIGGSMQRPLPPSDGIYATPYERPATFAGAATRGNLELELFRPPNEDLRGPPPSSVPPPPPPPTNGTLRSLQAPIFFNPGGDSGSSVESFYSAGEGEGDFFGEEFHAANFEPAPDYSDDEGGRRGVHDTRSLYGRPPPPPGPPPPPVRTTPVLLRSKSVGTGLNAEDSSSLKGKKKKKGKKAGEEKSDSWSMRYNTAGQLSGKKAKANQDQAPLDEMFVPPADYGHQELDDDNDPYRYMAAPPAPAPVALAPPPPPPPPPGSAAATSMQAKLQAELAKRKAREQDRPAGAITPSASAPQLRDEEAEPATATLRRKGPPPGANNGGFGDALQMALKAKLAQRSKITAPSTTSSESSDRASLSSFASSHPSPTKEAPAAAGTGSSLIAQSLRTRQGAGRPPFYRTDSSSSFSSLSSASTSRTAAAASAAPKAASSTASSSSNSSGGSTSPPKSKNPAMTQMTMNRNFNLYGTLPRAKPDKKDSFEEEDKEGAVAAAAVSTPPAEVVPIKLFGTVTRAKKPSPPPRPTSIYHSGIGAAAAALKPTSPVAVRPPTVPKPSEAPRPISIQQSGIVQKFQRQQAGAGMPRPASMVNLESESGAVVPGRVAASIQLYNANGGEVGTLPRSWAKKLSPGADRQSVLFGTMGRSASGTALEEGASEA